MHYKVTFKDATGNNAKWGFFQTEDAATAAIAEWEKTIGQCGYIS